MDDLLREFLTETNESLDTVDNQLVRFEQDPNNAKILDNIFRLVHTIKGTCGFLGLPPLEALAHAGETLMGKFGVNLRGESYGLLIDQIGEVLKLADDGREENPVNLDPRMAKLAGGVHRLDGQLMVVLDVDRVLELVPAMLAA
jgi:two-component system, chemotaxis family, sensor kinase CheA